MTDHHTEAERLLQESGDIPASDEANYIAMAQVHATLALADAVREKNEPSFDDLIAANREGMQEDYDRSVKRHLSFYGTGGPGIRAQEAADFLALADTQWPKPMTVTQHIAATEGTTPEEVTDRAMRRCAKDAQPQKVVQSVDADKARDVAAEIAALTKRAEDAREERDEQRIRAVAAEYDRDAFREQLDKIVSALGKAPSNRADLPRLVWELRDEREKASQGWCQALESNKHLLDRIRELEDDRD